MSEYVRVASTDEVEPGQGKLVEVQGKDIALFNVDEKYYAIDNTCTHRAPKSLPLITIGNEPGHVFQDIAGDIPGRWDAAFQGQIVSLTL